VEGGEAAFALRNGAVPGAGVWSCGKILVWVESELEQAAGFSSALLESGGDGRP
jgi:hypothetical protein